MSCRNMFTKIIWKSTLKPHYQRDFEGSFMGNFEGFNDE
jgi:hypothetical protein